VYCKSYRLSRWLLYRVRGLLSELLSGGKLLSLDADGKKLPVLAPENGNMQRGTITLNGLCSERFMAERLCLR
jgi:hypothetical protein